MDSESNNFNVGVCVGTVVGVLLQLVGFLLVVGDGSEFGWVIFLIVPFVSGFAVAAIVRRANRVAACCTAGLFINFSVLVFTGGEGILCCLMALPLVATGVASGALLGYLLRGRFIDRMTSSGRKTALLLLCCPLLIAAADRVERPFRSVEQREDVTTETTVDAPLEETWDLVAHMPTLDGPHPFLLRVGLPVARRCELDRAAVGGRRVCYFDDGIIAQEVTAWRRPSYMGLRITENTLPGRRWLTFIDASYELRSEGSQTRVVRHTAIGTRLYPRWYWRPLERWGVESEHEFVFSNLKRRAEER
ncbi:MAG: hypothetical protein WD875_19150 [Pirellulales bacterium]